MSAKQASETSTDILVLNFFFYWERSSKQTLQALSAADWEPEHHIYEGSRRFGLCI